MANQVFDYDAIYLEDLGMIQEALDQYLKEIGTADNVIWQAIDYSVNSNGKRLRPVIALEFCRACGKDPRNALPFACSSELIHTNSLIQDDLPCMDNASLRRGRPTCHIKYGESFALLASDALSVLSFDILLSNKSINQKAVLNAAKSLVNAVGVEGLVGGQSMDLLNENNPIDIDTLQEIYLLKTQSLFKVAAVLGCYAANASKKKIEAAENYSRNIGLAYQIVDDIIDVTGDKALIGKDMGIDIKRKKTTFPSLIGVEESRKYVMTLTEQAVEYLSVFGNKAEFLKEFSRRLALRNF